MSLSLSAMADNFNPAVWTLSLSEDSTGFVTTFAPNGFGLRGSNNMNIFGNPSDTSYSRTFTTSGTVSFDWSAHTFDVHFGFDPASIIFNGDVLVKVGIGTVNAKGSLSFAFSPGDVLTFDVYSMDNVEGAGTIGVNSYTETNTPEPGSLLLLGTGLFGASGMQRKKVI